MISSSRSRLIDTVEEFWTHRDLSQAIAMASPDSVAKFCREFTRFVGAEHFVAFPCSTGEQAIYYALRVALSRTSRRKVLVCGFNCHVVFQAIKSAGGEIVKFDRPAPDQYFDCLRDLILKTRPAALIVTHFFGAPEYFIELIEFAKNQGVFLIEDCAHCLGGEIGGRFAGTLADASIFSFNYDKPVSLLGGGLLLLSRVHTARLLDLCPNRQNLYSDRVIHESMSLALMRIWLHWRRHPFGFLGPMNRLFLRLLGNKIIQINRRVPFGPIRAALGSLMLPQYQHVVVTRCANAKHIDHPPDIIEWEYSNLCKPAWIKKKAGRFNNYSVSKIEQASKNQRIRIGNYNWPDSCATDLCVNKKNVEYSQFWIDIPIHQNLKAIDFKKINKILHEAK